MTSDDPPTRPGYCFVSGCPRSGTSALTRLLNAHPEVVIGEERYRWVVRDLHRAGRLHELGPELFTPERFLDVRWEDAGYPRERFAPLFDKAAARFRRQQVRWVGDKLIPLTRDLAEAFAANFPGVRLVFIHRDPVQVAGSFQRRAEDPDDSWSRRLDHRRAPGMWRRSVGALEHAVELLGPERVHVVAYEDLFSPGDAEVRSLFAFLGLEADRALPRWERNLPKGAAERDSGLSARQEARVLRRLRGIRPRDRAEDPRHRLARLAAATAAAGPPVTTR